jgi:hypothetical protein
MTPKEKAEEIHISMCYAIKEEENEQGFYANTIHAKYCSLVLIDQIIRELTEEISPSVHGFRHQYWEEVKHEIEKL